MLVRRRACLDFLYLLQVLCRRHDDWVGFKASSLLFHPLYCLYLLLQRHVVVHKPNAPQLQFMSMKLQNGTHQNITEIADLNMHDWCNKLLSCNAYNAASCTNHSWAKKAMQHAVVG